VYVVLIFQTKVERPSSRDRAMLIPGTRTLEECSVCGVGRFTAYTDGSLRVVFNDRTCLEMTGLHWPPHVYHRLLSQDVVSFLAFLKLLCCCRRHCSR